MCRRGVEEVGDQRLRLTVGERLVTLLASFLERS
jgi:hypothetical protein